MSRTVCCFVAILFSVLVSKDAHSQKEDVLNIDIAKGAGYTVEINKIMQKEDECVLFLISETRTQKAYPDFSVDLAMFDDDGKILGDLHSLIVPLKPNREIVSRFSLEDIACSRISRIHVNQIFCSQKDDAKSCYEKTAIRSRLGKEVTR
jgi:hypothetical protein